MHYNKSITLEVLHKGRYMIDVLRRPKHLPITHFVLHFTDGQIDFNFF